MGQEMQKAIARIHGLMKSGVHQEDLPRVMNLSESYISELINSELFAQLESEDSIDEEYEKQMETVDKGWDAVEEESIARVLQEVRTGFDPEFALKAAGMANKAQRRTRTTRMLERHRNREIAGGHGGKAVVALNINFMNRLESHGAQKTIEHRDNLLQKGDQRLDSVSPKSVSQILAGRGDVNPKLGTRESIEDQLDFSTLFSDLNDIVDEE